MKVVPIRREISRALDAVRDEGPARDDVPPPTPTPKLARDDEDPRRYERITVRAITVAVVLSLFIHFAVIFIPFMQNEQQMRAPGEEVGPLSVTIAQSKPQPKAQTKAEETPPVEQSKPQPPKATVRPKPVPQRPQIAINRPSTGFVVPPPAPAPAPAPEVAPSPQPAPDTNQDFSELIAQRQRARRAQNGGAPDSVVESDDDRAKRIATANVAAQQRSASPELDPNAGGGIFQIQRVGQNEAQFLFRGWNKSFRRNWSQQVEVKQGANPDIRIAVIRSMINIIREQKPGDFEWESHRLGKVLTMSARPKDQAQLETFLMREFFPDDARAR